MTATYCGQARGARLLVSLEPSNTTLCRSHTVVPMESRTRGIFLVIFSSRLFPSHWAIFVPSSEGSDTGTLINVVGDPSVGFEHEFKRDYGEEDERRVSKTLLLGSVACKHIKGREEVGQKTDDIPNNKLEDIALSIPPPSKSLRSSGGTVSIRTIHFSIAQGCSGRVIML